MSNSTGRPQVLVVCTGNICRSPLVERLLQPALDGTFGAGAVRVHSAGTGALVGAPMDERSAQILRDLGGDPGGFAARHLTEPMIAAAALVVTATRAHRAAVVRTHPRALRRAFTVRELAALLDGRDTTGLPTEPAERIAALADLARESRGTLARRDPEELDVVDPYRRPDDVYVQMRQQVVPALRTLSTALTPPEPAEGGQVPVPPA